MELTVIEPEIEKGISDITARALSLQVNDAESYIMAGEIFTIARKMVKEVEAFFRPLKQAQDQANKKLLDAEKAEIAKVQPAIDYLQRSMTTFSIEQDRRRKAEEERLRKEAEKAEEERRLAEAVQAEQEGDTYTAETLLNEPVFVPSPIVEPTVPKVAGIAMRTTWDFEVTSLSELVRAIAEGKAPISCIMPNDTFLRAQARAGRGNITYPGVRFYEKKGIGGARG